MSGGAVRDTRDLVFQALQGALVGSPWRVRRTAAVQPAAPSVFSDSPTLVLGASSIVSVSFPVVIIMDGSVAAQVDGLDDLVAQVWQALSKVGTVTDSRPAVLDVGGPSLRAQIVTVQTDVTAAGLCPPSLVPVSA